MISLTHLKTLAYYPTILRPYRRIILLSHMRAKTSLLGHILGSSPEIEGYYELHIGYYSWKSLLRQKLEYFTEHPPKKGAKYIFDKVLDNGHHVNIDLFSNKKNKIIFMIREPNSAIRSIMELYQKLDPTHEYATLQGASLYYTQRLCSLVETAESIKEGFLFIKAESITLNPDKALATLTKFLNLSTPLPTNYKIFRNTGKKYTGDSSENIAEGKIITTPTNTVPLTGLSSAVEELYRTSLHQLQAHSL